MRLARRAAVEDRPDLTLGARRLQLDELIAARSADVVITHSGTEEALLRAQLPGVAVAQVPWSVPVPEPARSGAEREGVVFVGYFGHEPNIERCIGWCGKYCRWCCARSRTLNSA